MPQDYPAPRFHFQVEWGGAKISFSEVTGIVMDSDKTEYRDAGDNTLSRKITGLIKNNNITLKRGKFERDFNYSAWINGITNKRVDNRRDMTIKLLNEKHEPVAVWTAARCFPVKVTPPDLKSDANEATIESLEITHEGLTLVKF
jgi:phage tail-like protein